MNNLYNNQNNVSMRKLGMDEMAEINGGGCGWALFVYSASFIGLCASCVATGGLAIIGAGTSIVGLADSIYDMFENC